MPSVRFFPGIVGDTILSKSEWSLSIVAHMQEVVMDDLKGKDILTADQFSKEDVWLILSTAERLEREIEKRRNLDLMKGYILATLFFEPSTRTRLSFETAMHRLGGAVISVAEGLKTSSVAKGESLADTARTVEQYSDVIVVRHPRIGSAQQVAGAASIPVLNGGDGAGQHPTQGLLDMYTIWKECGRLEDLTVALVGDLKHARNMHSASTLLSLFGIRLILVSPPSLAMSREAVEKLQSTGADVEVSEDLIAAALESDVLYLTRIQKERFGDPEEANKLRGSYVVDNSLVQQFTDKKVILHCLPRVGELDPEIDSYPGAAYFRQAKNGVYTRMALLSLVLGKA